MDSDLEYGSLINIIVLKLSTGTPQLLHWSFSLLGLHLPPLCTFRKEMCSSVVPIAQTCRLFFRQKSRILLIFGWLLSGMILLAIAALGNFREPTCDGNL
jgi:hypothetical protein